MPRYFKPARESFIPKGAIKIADKQSDAVAYLYTRAGKLYAMAFVGKQQRPLFHYRYQREESRERAVRETFENRRAQLAYRKQQAEDRKAFVPAYKVGDIFRTCWGYEQTNVEYFEIVEIRGKHAILRELAQERIETGFMQGSCVPLPGQYLAPRYEGDKSGQPIRRLMQNGRIKIDDVRTAWPVTRQKVGGVDVIQPTGWSSYH